jgi:RNA polymerase sigma-70 factor (ECF subfamily)
MTSLEKDLLEKIKNGDDKAFGFLFQNNYAQLCTFANDFLHKTDIAEEIVQDIFLKLWNSRNEISINHSLRAYLYKMVQNYSLNYIRDHSTAKTIKEEKMEDIDVYDNQINSAIANTGLEKILSDEAESDLNQALQQLPDQCREIFILCRFDGLSYSEIAQKKNISLSTVKTQMGRAMEKLHSSLRQHL